STESLIVAGPACIRHHLPNSSPSSIRIRAHMRGLMDVLTGRVGGFKKMEVARRTVPCYKRVIEKDGEKPALCLLVDSGKLYRFPFEDATGIDGLEIKARYLRGEMEHLRLREFQPGLCRYVERANQAV